MKKLRYLSLAFALATVIVYALRVTGLMSDFLAVNLILATLIGFTASTTWLGAHAYRQRSEPRQASS